MNPAFEEATIHDIFFDLLDRDRRLSDSEDTRSLARCRTNASGEFGEIIGRMKLTHSFFPAPAVDQVVPIRNQIIDWASGLAERYAAIHTARALSSNILLWEVLIDF